MVLLKVNQTLTYLESEENEFKRSLSKMGDSSGEGDIDDEEEEISQKSSESNPSRTSRKSKINSKKSDESNPMTFPKKNVFYMITYVLFFPTNLLLYALMPNMREKPNVSKILLSCIIIMLFTIGIMYLVFRIEWLMYTAYDIKLHLIAIFNGLVFGIKYCFLYNP